MFKEAKLFGNVHSKNFGGLLGDYLSLYCSIPLDVSYLLADAPLVFQKVPSFP